MNGPWWRALLVVACRHATHVDWGRSLAALLLVVVRFTCRAGMVYLGTMFSILFAARVIILLDLEGAGDFERFLRALEAFDPQLWYNLTTLGWPVVVFWLAMLRFRGRDDRPE